MPTCQKDGCGYELKKSWKFCPKCGTPNHDNVAYPLRLVRKTDFPLTPEDWEVIEALPLSADCKAKLKEIRMARNEPDHLLCVYAGEFNKLCTQRNLPYRVIYARQGRHGSEHKIYKTVPRD